MAQSIYSRPGCTVYHPWYDYKTPENLLDQEQDQDKEMPEAFRKRRYSNPNCQATKEEF